MFPISGRRFAAAATRRLLKAIRDLGFGHGLSRTSAISLIEKSGIFDSEWYSRTYLAGREPRQAVRHYLDVGAELGYNPSPLFWTAWYGDRHPEAASFGGGPLSHYLKGLGSNPNPVFDNAHYRSQTDDLGLEAPLSHFIRAGWRLGLNPHPVFDTAWYVDQIGDQLGSRDPLSHFLDTGGRDGLSPSPYFNSSVYLKNTADFIKMDDVTSGLWKAAVFGFIIAVMGCYHGFNSKGGAQGVGRATTNAVVSSAILILAANFALTSLLFTE